MNKTTERITSITKIRILFKSRMVLDFEEILEIRSIIIPVKKNSEILSRPSIKFENIGIIISARRTGEVMVPALT